MITLDVEYLIKKKKQIVISVYFKLLLDSSFLGLKLKICKLTIA
jgi:hypothetical protein